MMKWKDTGTGNGGETDQRDPYTLDESDLPASKEEDTAGMAETKPANRYLFWGVGIAGVVILALFLFNGFFESDETERVSALEQRIAYLEQQLEKIDGVDEKVTHIWEQAKAFEHFKTRFDRSEASISLRIDRLARGLDAQQKKTDSALAQIRTLEKRAGDAVPPSRSASTDGGGGAKIHIVAKGDTLYGISRRYDLSIDALRSINNLSDGDLLKVGQILVVSVPTASN